MKSKYIPKICFFGNYNCIAPYDNCDHCEIFLKKEAMSMFINNTEICIEQIKSDKIWYDKLLNHKVICRNEINFDDTI
jgi:hypothetical protein